jgi:DNA-binding NtrC family response regulator
MRVLVVDDEPPVRLAIERMLRTLDCEVVLAEDGIDAQAQMAQLDVDLVITDLRMPRADGFEVLRAARERPTPVPVIVVTGHGSTAECVRAMRAGATDFIGKPFHAETLRQVVRNALRTGAAQDAAQGPPRGTTSFPQAALVGDSPQLRSVLDQIERIADSDVPVLLVGEPHTGKEAIARLLHAASPRAGTPLITVACADTAADQLEEELFGADGAGGSLALADGGTLLLTGLERLGDEPRARLARALATRIAPAGDGARANVRLLVDVDVDPGSGGDAGAFASALQEIVDGVMIEVPPLRERAQDLPVLVDYVLQAANRTSGKRVDTRTLLSALTRYSWPGNLNELETRISRYLTEAPAEPSDGPAGPANAFMVPVERVGATLVLSDGTRHEVVLPRGAGQSLEELLAAREPFMPVQQDGSTRIYARSALASVAVRDDGEPEDEALPRSRRSVRVRLHSGVVLEGELRYVVVEGRARLTDVLNEDSETFCIHAGGAVHHIAKAHVLCVEEC